MVVKSKVLFLDASSMVVQVGILFEGQWLSYYHSEEAALESIFKGIEICLKMAGIEFHEIGGFAYCEGPGSLLGIRLVAMAIRGWKAQECFKNVPVWAYNSFELALKLIKKVHNPKDDYAVIGQSRKGFWNVLGCPDGVMQEFWISDIKNYDGGLWLFKQRPLDIDIQGMGLRMFDYKFEDYPEIFLEENMLKSRLDIDAFVVKESQYVKWDHKRHGGKS